MEGLNLPSGTQSNVDVSPYPPNFGIDNVNDPPSPTYEFRGTSKDMMSETKKATKKARKRKNPEEEVVEKEKRFSWSEEMGDQVVASILEAKTRFEIKNLDFEKDLVALYSEVRQIMAEKYNNVFGPVVSTMIDELMDSDEVKATKKAQIVKVTYIYILCFI